MDCNKPFLNDFEAKHIININTFPISYFHPDFEVHPKKKNEAINYYFIMNIYIKYCALTSSTSSTRWHCN